MPKITFVRADGHATTVNAVIGQSAMQTAMAHGIDGMVAECGGSAMCATCHVYVEDAFADRLPPATEIESEMLDCVAAERRPTSRLSCQITMRADLDGLRVHLPEMQR